MAKDSMTEHSAQKQPRRKKSDKGKRNFELNGKASQRHIRLLEVEAEKRASNRRNVTNEGRSG